MNVAVAEGLKRENLPHTLTKSNTLEVKETNFHRDTYHMLGIKYEDLDLETKYLERDLAMTDNDALKASLEERLERVKAEMLLRANTVENDGHKFVGIFSYSLGVT